MTLVTPSACSPASRTALFTCALGVVGRCAIACSFAPCTINGACPSVASIRAPIRSSGSITRRIGRRDSEASPTKVVENGVPASTPDRSRIVVPELPQSSSARRRTELPEASSQYGDGAVGRFVDLDAESAQAGERRPAVGSWCKMGKCRLAFGECREQCITVGD